MSQPNQNHQPYQKPDDPKRPVKPKAGQTSGGMAGKKTAPSYETERKEQKANFSQQPDSTGLKRSGSSGETGKGARAKP